MIISFLNLNSLYPIFAGKVKKKGEEDKVNWIYAENKKTRNIAFIEFENLTRVRKGDFDDYKSSIPNIIGKKLQSIQFITTTSNDFIPIYNKLEDSYHTREISFEDAEKNKVLMDEIFNYGRIISTDLLQTNTSSTNNLANSKTSDNDLFVVVTNTYTNADYFLTNTSAAITNTSGDYVYTVVTSNQVKKDINKSLGLFSLVTNNTVAYWITNVKESKYKFYVFKKDRSLYFDPNLIAPYLKYFSNQDVNFKTDSDGRFFYPLDKIPKKSLTLSPNLYRLNDAPLGNILAKKEVDYFVYGSFKVQNDVMELNIYVINVYEKKIVHIYSDKFRNREIKKRIDNLDLVIMSYLQNKRLIKDIAFLSEPEGGLLYLDNRFMGTLPQRIDQWVEGEYSYEVWRPNSKLLKASSSEDISLNTINLENPGSETKFNFETAAEAGRLEVEIKNNVKSDIYINSKLMDGDKRIFYHDLSPGDYFITIKKTNYVSRNFKVDIESNRKTKILFDIEEVKPLTTWEKILKNYNLNAKIFAGVGLAFGAATIGTYIYTLNLEDKINGSDKRIKDLEASGGNTIFEEKYLRETKDEYNKFVGISLGLLSGSLLSFTTTLIFHTLDIWSNQAPIETRFNHNSDVEFRYIKEF